MNNNIITIDGPAGSGKSTVAKLVARELGLTYIDTGAMYRAATLLALEEKIDLEDENEIINRLSQINLQLDNSATDEFKYTSVTMDGREVTEDIRSEKVGAAVSIVSKLSGVRKYLVKLQRKMAKRGRAVLEGRDTGSVVCPRAVLKIFLTASIQERVRRRLLQIRKKGGNVDEKAIEKEIKERDRIDSNRKDSPLVVPEGGIIIDTTNMSIKEVVTKIKELYTERINAKN